MVTFGQICNFRDPNLVTFYFYELTHFFRLNEEHFAFHLHYKHSGTFAKRKYEELSYPKNLCDPILVTLLKMRPHYSKSSRENATPSSGTSPLASEREAPPPPPEYSRLSSHLSGKQGLSCEISLAARSEDGRLYSQATPNTRNFFYSGERKKERKTYRVLLRQTKFSPYKLLI